MAPGTAFANLRRRVLSLTLIESAGEAMTNGASDNAGDEADVRPLAATPKQPSATSPVILSSKDLLRGAREVWIEHGEEMYRLRLTAAGKLLLTK